MKNINKFLHIFFLAMFCLSLTVPTYSYAQNTQGAFEQNASNNNGMTLSPEEISAIGETVSEEEMDAATDSMLDSAVKSGVITEEQAKQAKDIVDNIVKPGKKSKMNYDEVRKISWGEAANDVLKNPDLSTVALVGGGAFLGAKIGSAFGPIGTVVGAVVGAVLGAIFSIFKRKSEAQKRLEACKVSKFIKKYCGCFSCSTVAVMVTIFLQVAAKGSGIMQQAAQTILLIFTALWIAIFFLKRLSSFSAIELNETIQSLLFFLFKILVAWIFINGGFALASHYTLEPIMSFGTTLGQEFLEMVSDDPIDDVCKKGN